MRIVVCVKQVIDTAARIELKDQNSFTKMFNTTFALWKRTFERDKKIIASNIRDLEMLSKQYIRLTKK